MQKMLIQTYISGNFSTFFYQFRPYKFDNFSKYITLYIIYLEYCIQVLGDFL